MSIPIPAILSAVLCIAFTPVFIKIMASEIKKKNLLNAWVSLWMIALFAFVLYKFYIDFI